MTCLFAVTSDPGLAGRHRLAPLAHVLWLALALAVAAPVHTATGEDVSSLQRTIDDVARKWPDIAHVPAAGLLALQADKRVLVFDVRTPEEFAVSHLDGAVRVDPGIDAAAFLAEHGAAAKDKAVVFYCSVGVRSSRLTERVGAGLKAQGALSVGELKGGIFAWAADARPLVDAKGPTDKVHGYDSTWGRLVKDPKTLETRERK